MSIEQRIYQSIAFHYRTTYKPNIIVRFMFGVPAGVLESMYGGAENIPITGLISGVQDLL